MTTTPAGATAATRPAPRRRRWPWVLGVLAVLGLGGWWWVARQLEPDRLAATVLARAGDALGLELTIDGTPEYALRPEPRLLLPNLVARMPGAATPLLAARRVEVSLPWSTLTGDTGEIVITRVELDAPVLDLAALDAWLASRPPADEPFVLPTLTNGIDIADGRVLGDGWSIEGLALSLPELRPDAPAAATFSATWKRADAQLQASGKIAADRAGLVTPLRIEAKGEYTAATQQLPFAATLAGNLDAAGDTIALSAMALQADGRLRSEGSDAPWKLAANGDLALADGDVALQALTLTLDGDGPLPDLHAEGSLAWGDATTLALAGELTQWPATWPALPPPLVAADAPLAFRVAYSGSDDLAAPLTLDVERDATTLHSVLVVPEVLAWLDADDAGLLPPLRGELATPQLQVGAFVLEDVRIRVVDDAPAAGTGGEAEAAGDGETAEPRR